MPRFCDRFKGFFNPRSGTYAATPASYLKYTQELAHGDTATIYTNLHTHDAQRRAHWTAFQQRSNPQAIDRICCVWVLYGMIDEIATKSSHAAEALALKPRHRYHSFPFPPPNKPCFLKLTLAHRSPTTRLQKGALSVFADRHRCTDESISTSPTPDLFRRADPASPSSSHVYNAYGFMERIVKHLWHRLAKDSHTRSERRARHTVDSW